MNYVPRLADAHLRALLSEFSALLVTGPRSSGKTTTAQQHSKTVLRLDEPGTASAVEADPDAAIRSLAEPVLIDEWQLAPAVLGAIKRSVDTDLSSRPGRFVVTGSVHGDLESPTWPGTGRLIRFAMTGLTGRELLGRDLTRPPFLDLVAEHGADGLRVPAGKRTDLRDYVALAVRGGFPEAAQRSSERMIRNWAIGYLEQLFVRDLPGIDGSRDPARLRRYFTAYALNTAGVTSETKIAAAADIAPKTAAAYERLLHNLFIVDSVPAWSSNRIKRLSKAPKRFVVDTSLIAATLKLGTDGIMRDGDILGRLLETFVAAQLRAELQLGHQAQLYHLRDQNGEREIDLIAELDVNRIIAIEVKATSAPRENDARHLKWLRDELGTRFVTGVVFHTGPQIFQLGERIVAAPISTLWG